MVYHTSDPNEKFGSASRTITLPLGYWAMIAEMADINKTEFKGTLMFCIKTAHREVMSIKLHK